MPLIKSASKKVLQKNIDIEMESNPSPKDRAQNLAIAYSVKRQAKRKKMADGGMVKPGTPSTSKGISYVNKPDSGYGGIIFKAEGGMVDEEELMSELPPKKYPGMSEDRGPAKGQYMADHFAEGGMIDQIRARRKMMAEGGMVDLNENAMERPESFDKRNAAILKENYDSDMEDVSQPMDSNEHGHMIDEDEHDMISAIRSKIHAKRMFR